MKKETYTIDAKDQVLGRLASQIATILRGKNKADFVPNKEGSDFVVVKNVEKIKVTGKKYTDKIYYRHSGYMGGLKQATFKEIFEKNPSQVLRKAVYGMLPKNKLRDEQIKRLKFE
jgi:large subunit ribosomal protein L13